MKMLAFHQPKQERSARFAFDLADEAEISGEAQTLRQILIYLMSESIETAAPMAPSRSTAAHHRRGIRHVGGRRIANRKLHWRGQFSMVLARHDVQLRRAALERHGGSDGP